MNLKDAFAILKSNQAMDYREVRKSYIELVSVWHPDRFTYNEGLRKKAIEEMKQINIAWETIKNDFEVRNKYCRTSQATSLNKPAIVVRCTNCGTINRILRDTPFVASIKCGKCRKNLYADSHSTNNKIDDIFEEIRFCAADSCGRIQANGRCNQCGKTPQQVFETVATAKTNNRMKIFICMITGGILYLFSCFLWPEITTNATRRSSQLSHGMNGSIISPHETKKISHFNEKVPELPLSADKNSQDIISKEIIVPFEIIKK